MTQIHDEDLRALERRVGPVHLRQRLGIERDNEARVFGQGINFFHIENWYSMHGMIRGVLRVTGLHGRGRRNALRLRVFENEIALPRLSPAFDGFRILHVSDLHLDMNDDVPHALIDCVRDIEYDVCVLTGDFRGKTYGPYARVVEALRAVRVVLKDPVYGVLGNHDTIALVPGFEAVGVRMLLNESVVVTRAGATLHIAGVDDAHYYRMANLEAAARDIPADAASILLCHTPELFRHAAHAGFGAMLSGHTHGGQICLPGGFPLMLNARCPRRFCVGAWKFHDMIGYTSRGSGVSIVDVRYNCPAEVTVHVLRAGR
jgi:predicted MPP superfamily phosphohydrolase